MSNKNAKKERQLFRRTAKAEIEKTTKELCEKKVFAEMKRIAKQRDITFLVCGGLLIIDFIFAGLYFLGII